MWEDAIKRCRRWAEVWEREKQIADERYSLAFTIEDINEEQENSKNAARQVAFWRHREKLWQGGKSCG